MADMKRAIKDSVFTFLFRQPEYALQLYQTLHPEDTTVMEDDLTLVTLENVLSNGMYNDLGIRVKNKLLFLVEAQSTFSQNITLRLLLYLAATYKEYIEQEKLDLYSPKAVHVPMPELYVVYTGNKENVPEILHFSDLYDGLGSLDLSVYVLRRDGCENIIDQYMLFCEISDEQRRKYGYTQKAVEETIRLCLERGVLTAFLLSRRKEVTDIMVTLFSQEKIAEIHDYNVAKDAKAEGIQEGIQTGMHEGILSIAKNMLSAGMALEQIISLTGLTAKEVEGLRIHA